MKNFGMLLFIGVLLIASLAYCQERNPFLNLLPKSQETVTGEGQESQGPVPEVALPKDIVIQGVFWNTDTPQVIINGKIYKEKEKIKDSEIEIIKIDKGFVHLLYAGRIFIKSTSRGKESESKEQTQDPEKI